MPFRCWRESSFPGGQFHSLPKQRTLCYGATARRDTENRPWLLRRWRRFPPTFEGLGHFRLWIDAQGVGDPVDVVKVGDHLDRVQNVAIAQTVLAKSLELFRPDRRGFARKELGKSGKRDFAWRKASAEIIVFNLFGEFGVSGFMTEILSVGFDSIKAVVSPGDNRGEQLALGAREAGRPAHGREVELHRSAKSARVQALNPNNVKDPPRPVHSLVVFDF